jgi:hypothetical protein
MDELYKESCEYEKYKELLEEPLDADIIAMTDKSNRFCHYFECEIITKDEIKKINKNILLKNKIESLYFVYADYGDYEFHGKYWITVGKIIKNLYFVYESGCSGTGFGLGSYSKLIISKSPELLYNYGLTDKQRDLINKNINDRYILKKGYIQTDPLIPDYYNDNNIMNV